MEFPFGARAPAGHFRCADCGQEMWNRATAAIPPCPNLRTTSHRRHAYEVIGGLDDLLHVEEEVLGEEAIIGEPRGPR